MEFNNLEINILYSLEKNWSANHSRGPFETQQIYRDFADIPDQDIKAALEALNERGLLWVYPETRDLTLTARGVIKIKSMNRHLKVVSRD